ncbi:low temperature requirement protein A [Streptomyces albidochromogenes]|uniref:low temperature requirement protein A n=1 Tax=Streptomyces albidochromogenes TaxID=329524 RepID=UPI00110F928A|nr:low temperature requirement protein A [Streptomyces albidochromogenes]
MLELEEESAIPRTEEDDRWETSVVVSGAMREFGSPEPAFGATPAAERSRHAGWLELFFDLVFVALAAQLAHSLHGDPGPADFAVFLALYFPPWWTWINLTVAANIFDEDSTRRRLLMLTAMLCLAVMTVAVTEATDERSAAYALGYAGSRLVLLGLWWPSTRRAIVPGGALVPRWRPLFYCLASAVGWVASVLVPTPWRFVMWAGLLAAEIGVLLTARPGGMPRRLHVGHLVERVGLFVIIVFGESVIGLITSLDAEWTAAAGWVALIGFVMLAALWWSYFDFGSAAAEHVLGAATERRAFPLARDVTGFLHFFVTAAVVAMAGGLATAVEEAGQGHTHLAHGAVVALAGGLALYHAAHAAISLRFGRRLWIVATWAGPGIGVPLAVIAFARHLAPWQVVGLLTAEVLAHLLYARWASARAPAAGADAQTAARAPRT